MATENSTTQTEKTINPQLEAIFEEIGTLANAVRYMLRKNELHAFIPIVEKLGFLADLGLSKITGSPQVVGDAEDWMLSRSYRDEKKAAEARHE